MYDDKYIGGSTVKCGTKPTLIILQSRVMDGLIILQCLHCKILLKVKYYLTKFQIFVCYTEDIALQVAPSVGPMTGGNRITLMHGCGLNSRTPVCVFKQGDTILQTLTEVETVDSAVYCIPGPFFVTGDVTILVYKTLEQAEMTPPPTAFITAKYTVGK